MAWLTAFESLEPQSQSTATTVYLSDDLYRFDLYTYIKRCKTNVAKHLLSVH